MICQFIITGYVFFRARRSSIISFGVFGGVALGRAVNALEWNGNDRLDRFLIPYVREEVAKKGNSSEWDGTGNGGYVIRFELDVTGDGRDEVFISGSLASFRTYAEWEVLSVDESGNMHPYFERLRLSLDSIWTGRAGDQSELLQESPPSDDEQREGPQEDWKYPVYHYVFEYLKIRSRVEHLAYNEVQELRKQGQSGPIECKAILLSDYVNSEGAEWSSVGEWRLNANEYFVIPADSAKISGNSKFTPEVALSRLEERANFRKLRIANQSVINSGSENPPKAGGKGETVLWAGRYVLIALLLLCGMAIVWLLSRRRKAG